MIIEYVTILLEKAIELRQRQPNILDATKEVATSYESPVPVFLSSKAKKMAEIVAKHYARFTKP